MNESDEPGRDPLEAILGPNRGSPENADLRAALLERTTGIIRQRRRLRRLAMVAALAAFYLAGAATAGVWWAWRPVVPAATPKEGSAGGEAAPAAGTRNPSEPRRGPRVPAPEGTEQAVATAKVTRFEAYRRAGDRFLREPAQLSLAVRSYGNALNVASDAERAISPERDSWLLMALKESRLKERSHGNRDH
jgi:hypothetical protein